VQTSLFPWADAASFQISIQPPENSDHAPADNVVHFMYADSLDMHIDNMPVIFLGESGD
jgi:hypothetical protein